MQEATSQADYIKTRIVRHQGSSPTSIHEAIDQMIKSTKSVMYKMVLMQERIRTLEEANRTISKRRKAKKTRIQQGGVFSIQNANTLLNAREVDV